MHWLPKRGPRFSPQRSPPSLTPCAATSPIRLTQPSWRNSDACRRRFFVHNDTTETTPSDPRESVEGWPSSGSRSGIRLRSGIRARPWSARRGGSDAEACGHAELHLAAREDALPEQRGQAGAGLGGVQLGPVVFGEESPELDQLVNVTCNQPHTWQSFPYSCTDRARRRWG